MLTLNCHSLQGFDTRQQINEFVDQIVREKVAIFALQEANQPQKTPLIANEKLIQLNYQFPLEKDFIPLREGNFAYLMQQALLKVKLNFSWSWCATHALKTGYDEGLALFSLVPLKSVSTKIIVHEPQITYQSLRHHKILAGKLANQEQSLIVTTHLDGQQSQSFTFEWDIFLSHLHFLGFERHPTYVLANVNVDAKEDVEDYQYMCQKLNDTYVKALSKGDGLTIRGYLEGWGKKDIARRLDYILTNAKYEIVSSRVCFDGHESQKISDHAAVIVEFEDQNGELLA